MLKETAASGIIGAELWYESMQAKFHTYMNNKYLHKYMIVSMFAKILNMSLSDWCNFCIFLVCYQYYFKFVPTYILLLQKQCYSFYNKLHFSSC